MNMEGSSGFKDYNSSIDLEENKQEACSVIISEDNPISPEKVLRLLVRKGKDSAVSMGKMVLMTGKKDPRRVIHSMKVGLALSLVSVFYFVRPLFDSVGGNAIWAAMTVVVVFEFSVGATLSKGLNRSCATLLAGLLGVGVSYLAEFAGSGSHYQRFILAASVFVLGACCTFSRFIPNIKERYDYGVVIFILTFNLVAISAYRVDNIFTLAHQRVCTILIGCALCFLINTLVFPIWAGDDLHDSTIKNLEGLASSLEACVLRYFEGSALRSSNDDAENGVQEIIDENGVSEWCKRILNSKATEASLANFARWEIPRKRFGFRHPWIHYTKIGCSLRYSACCVEALNALLKSEIQAPLSVKGNLKEPCMNVGKEAAGLVRALVQSMSSKNKVHDRHVEQLLNAVKNLHEHLICQPHLLIDSKRWRLVQRIDDVDTTCMCMDVVSPHNYVLTEVLPLASFASLLMETAARLRSVVSAVDLLLAKSSPPSSNSRCSRSSQIHVQTG